MHEYDDPAGGRRIRRGQVVGCQRKGLTAMSDHHRAGQRIFVVGQLVAVDAVQRGQECADRVAA